MKARSVARWIPAVGTPLLLMPLLVAQGSSRRSAAAAPAHGAATLVLTCDLACDWELDGEDEKSLAAGATARARVDAGEHLIVATSSDGKDKVKKEFDVRPGASAVIQLKLRPARIARLTRELEQQEKNIGLLKNETQPSPAPAPDPTSASASSGRVQSNPAPETPAAVPESSGPLEISAVVAQDLLISKSAPEYPPVARARGISGTVVLHGTITPDGSVEDLTVNSGPELLRQAALDAVKTWKYKPYLVNNRAVPVKTTFQIAFQLVPPPAPDPVPPAK